MIVHEDLCAALFLHLAMARTSTPADQRLLAVSPREGEDPAGAGGVTIPILSRYRITDPDAACAAPLHDAVEDYAGGIARHCDTRQSTFNDPGQAVRRAYREPVAAVTSPATTSMSR